MAFSIDTRDLPRLSNYAAALAHFDKVKSWPHGPDSERPLAKRSAKHKMIRRLPDGSIACRLHNTDVVTYHPDNTVTLRPYASVSTDAFANTLLPGGIRTYFNTGHYYLMQAGEKFYALPLTGATFSLDTLKPITPTLLFIHRQLDKKKANAAREAHKFADFKAFVKMYARMCGPVPSEYALVARDISTHLMNGEYASCLYFKHFRVGQMIVDIDRTLSNVRLEVYKAGDAIITTEKLALDGWTEYQAVVRGEKYA